MKFKKVLVTIVAGAVLSSNMIVSADYYQNKVIQEPITTISISTTGIIQNTDTNYSLIVNGQTLDLNHTKLYIKNDDTVMIPLRAVAEALGYEVKWVNETRSVELTKGAQWILVKTDENYYCFGKMAPVELESAAEIKNDRTYVPLSFATDILKATVVDNKAGLIEISNQKSINGIEGTIKEINSTGKNTMVLIEGKRFATGLDKEFEDSMILILHEESLIVNPVSDEALTVDDLKVGDYVRGYHDEVMTASIPAQSGALKIELLKDVAAKSGTITEIIINDITKQVLIGDMMDGIILNITDDTIIVTQDNESLTFEDLKSGMKVDAYHSLIMTRSLPPISTAVKVVVTEGFDNRLEAGQEVHYEIERVTNAGENKADYPQVRNYKGELYMDYINQSLRKIADKYSENNVYSNIDIDYEVTRMDEKVLSVLYKGTVEIKDIGVINIQESINLDMAKSTNEIEFDNLVKNTDEARNAVFNILNEKAQGKGLLGYEAEGVRLYFTKDHIVFYYMPLDDSAREFIELSIPEADIIYYINSDFGEGPVS